MIHFKNKKLWVMLFFLVSIAYGMDNNNNLDQNFLELDDIDIYKLEMSKRELVAKYNEKIEDNPKICTYCVRTYAEDKVFEIDLNNACFKCIRERFTAKRIMESNFQYKEIPLCKFYGTPHKDGFVPAQFLANSLFCALSICIYFDPFHHSNSNSLAIEEGSGEAGNTAERFGAICRQILPFFFGANAILTIVHGGTKYWGRRKECPFAIIPTKGAGFQLFVSASLAFAYWIGNQKDIVGGVILCYGFADQLSLWTGQNIGMKLHDRSYVTDWELGIQKALNNCQKKKISENVLANAWFEGRKWDFKTPLFALAQICLFLNTVSSLSLLPYFNNTHEIGVENKFLGNLLIVSDVMCWIFILFGVLVRTVITDGAQGPVLSMNVFTRLVVTSVFAGLNGFKLSTKMAMNYVSIVALIGAFVIPWQKMFEDFEKLIQYKFN